MTRVLHVSVLLRGAALATMVIAGVFQLSRSTEIAMRLFWPALLVGLAAAGLALYEGRRSKPADPERDPV